MATKEMQAYERFADIVQATMKEKGRLAEIHSAATRKNGVSETLATAIGKLILSRVPGEEWVKTARRVSDQMLGLTPTPVGTTRSIASVTDNALMHMNCIMMMTPSDLAVWGELHHAADKLTKLEYK